MRNRLTLLGVGAAVLAGFAAPGAQASTANLGQLGTGSCGGGGYSEVQAGTGAAPSYAVPSAGAVTSWTYETNGDTDDVVKLRIFRPTGTPDEFKVIGDSPSQGPLPANVTNGPFPASIPVEAGDLLGLGLIAGASPVCIFTTGVTGDVAKEFFPDNAAVGDVETATTTFNVHRVDIAAVFTPSPAVSAVTPSSGPSLGGTKVIVGGSDFSGATAVHFGGIAASSFTVTSDSVITAVTPAAKPATIDVQVTTPGGTSPAVAADRFTFGCLVPNLKGKRLKRAKRTLRKRDCRLGKVKGDRSGKVRRQNPKPGTVSTGRVNVTLG